MVNGPFRAYHRPMPQPDSIMSEALRNNPYLKSIVEQPIGITEPLSANGSTDDVASPKASDTQGPSTTPKVYQTAARYIPIPTPTLDEYKELLQYLKEQHERHIELCRNNNLFIKGRERDKLCNRCSRIPNLVIEVRLKGIEGFKQECEAWETAMFNRTLLQRRDFYRDRVQQVEQIVAKLEADPKNKVQQTTNAGPEDMNLE